MKVRAVCDVLDVPAARGERRACESLGLSLTAANFPQRYEPFLTEPSNLVTNPVGKAISLGEEKTKEFGRARVIRPKLTEPVW